MKKKKTKNYGVKVSIKFKEEFKNKYKDTTLRNVTEIHYNYPSLIGNRIAFESDIHFCGITYFLNIIDEFETFSETSKAKEF